MVKVIIKGHYDDYDAIWLKDCTIYYLFQNLLLYLVTSRFSTHVIRRRFIPSSIFSFCFDFSLGELCSVQNRHTVKWFKSKILKNVKELLKKIVKRFNKRILNKSANILTIDRRCNFKKLFQYWGNQSEFAIIYGRLRKIESRHKK